MKKRPLVYVYDLPAEFSSQLLQGRHFKFQCVNRLYTPLNVTLWTENLYGAKIALYETLLASEHRTTNGDEADFFYVPLLHACIVEQADAAPHLSMQVLSGINTLVVEGTCIFYACELFIHEWMYCQFIS